MNDLMRLHTRKLTARFLVSTAIFSITASVMSVSIRYQHSLNTLHSRVRMLASKVEAMKAATTETRESIKKISKALPVGYGSKSPEWVIFSRVDEIKATMSHSDMTVSSIEEKEGKQTLKFSLKPAEKDYNRLINNIGSLESTIFPFVSVTSVVIGSQDRQTPQSSPVTIEGTISVPAASSSEAKP